MIDTTDQSSESPKADESDRMVRELILKQRLESDAQKHQEWKKRQLKEGSSSADQIIGVENACYENDDNPQSLSFEELRLQALEIADYEKRMTDDRASELLIEKLAKEDKEVSALAAQQNLTPQELLAKAQADHDEAFKRDKEKFLNLCKTRKRPGKIVGVKASVVKQGTSTNVILRREGDRNIQSITDIQMKHLGTPEWIEVHDIIKNSTAANMMGLHKIVNKFFDGIRHYEAKFNIKDSILKEISLSPHSPHKRPSKRRKIADMNYRMSSLPEIEADDALNVQLPEGITFDEGKVIDNPAGMFYSTFHGKQRFFRLNEVHIASTRFLYEIRKRCAMTSNDAGFIKAIDEVLALPERLADPVTQEIKAEQTWD